MTLVMGVEQLLDLGYPFDVRAGATALLRLLSIARLLPRLAVSTQERHDGRFPAWT